MARVFYLVPAFAALSGLGSLMAMAEESFWVAQDCSLNARASQQSGDIVLARTWLECMSACQTSAANTTDPNRCTAFTFIETDATLKTGLSNVNDGIPACFLHAGPVAPGSGSTRVSQHARFTAGTLVDLSAWNPTQPENVKDKDCDWLSTGEYHVFRRPLPEKLPDSGTPGPQVELSPATVEALSARVSEAVSVHVERELHRALAAALGGKSAD